MTVTIDFAVIQILVLAFLGGCGLLLAIAALRFAENLPAARRVVAEDWLYDASDAETQEVLRWIDRSVAQRDSAVVSGLQPCEPAYTHLPQVKHWTQAPYKGWSTFIDWRRFGARN